MMRFAGKPVMFGVPVVMVTLLLTVLALWAWGPIGGSASGAGSNAGLVWNVEYWHRNAAGEVLQHKKDSNAIVASGLEHAVERLIAASSTVINLAFTDPAAAEIGEANAFDQIVLMNADDNLDTSGAGGTGASDGIDSTQILLLVDGGGGNNSGQTAGGVKNNPADGLYADVGTISDGDGKVTLQFLADGNPDAATQMHLVKAAPDDTAGAAADIVAADILATIEISVDLADTDTLTITWTVDVD